MVTPAAKREAVAHLRTAFDMSERQACKIIGYGRMTMRYRSRRRPMPNCGHGFRRWPILTAAPTTRVLVNPTISQLWLPYSQRRDIFEKTAER